VPLRIGAAGILGVLDLDSPNPGRFDAEDRAGVEKLAAIYVTASSWTQAFTSIEAPRADRDIESQELEDSP
jgi:hypothetical protein